MLRVLTDVIRRIANSLALPRICSRNESRFSILPITDPHTQICKMPTSGNLARTENKNADVSTHDDKLRNCCEKPLDDCGS